MPAALGDLATQCTRLGFVVTRGDHHRDAVHGGVAESEIAEHRDIEYGAGHFPLAALTVVDQISVRAFPGEERHTGWGQRQSNEGAFRFESGQHGSHDVCGLFTTLDHVHMGVGLIADDDVGAFDHVIGQVGVQVQGHHQARAVASCLT